ncbi:Uncharacterized protein Fot_28047 [Forsythia ovata]|uniref:Uncharacterized protein n=1 Tax=Forsythia ovata TaxID=205694 RepID=A0ABD1TMW3_9LAMI
MTTLSLWGLERTTQLEGKYVDTIINSCVHFCHYDTLGTATRTDFVNGQVSMGGTTPTALPNTLALFTKFPSAVLAVCLFVYHCHSNPMGFDYHSENILLR